jgi:hypothetical protein
METNAIRLLAESAGRPPAQWFPELLELQAEQIRDEARKRWEELLERFERPSAEDLRQAIEPLRLMYVSRSLCKRQRTL